MSKKQNINEWLNIATSKIKSPSPRLDAEILLAHYLNKNRAYLYSFAEQLLPDTIYPKLEYAIKQIAKGYPLAYILGKKDFWDMTLKVSEDTLIPRADSEILIETCKKLLPISFSGKLIDLGTGSGAIAIALSRIFPKATIIATDNNKAALSVALENAKYWQKSSIKFIYADWFSSLEKQSTDIIFPAHEFDVIISNPPYIKENDPHLNNLCYEPITALVSADQGLADIKTIIEQAADKLKDQGYLMLEHGYDQKKYVVDCFTHNKKWQNIKTIRDLGNNDRVTLAQYII